MNKTAREEGSPVSTKGDANIDDTTTDATVAIRNPKRARPSPPRNASSSTTNNNLVGSSAAELAAANVNRHTLAGRRGDIRMHKAVAARLADPFLSPFEALKIGGFDYPSDEEQTSVDSDKVTLGQRKNQLSRRLRLAKKQIMGADGNNTNGECSSGLSSLGSSSSHHHAPSSKTRGSNNRKDSSTPPLVPEGETGPCHHSHKHAHYHHDDHSSSSSSRQHTTTRKKAASSLTSHNNSISATRTITEASAMASLMASAQAMGLTLNQLADTVATNQTYLSQSAKISTSSTNMPKHEKVAMRLHAIESKSLYEKSLVLAGADVDKEYAPNSHSHLSFCYHAWQAEGKRLHAAMDEHHYPQKQNNKRHGGDSHHHQKEATNHNHNHGHSHQHSHHHHDHHGDDHDLTKPGAFAHKASASCQNHAGLHLHRLDGQCGHKAVIHRPKDGVPHIDFIVGDVVECYHGVDPIRKPLLPPKKAQVATLPVMKWQSKYTCDQVDCSAPHDCGGNAVDHQDQEVVGGDPTNSTPNETNNAGTTNHNGDSSSSSLTTTNNNTASPPSHNNHSVAAVAAAAAVAEGTTTASATPAAGHNTTIHDHDDHHHHHHHHPNHNHNAHAPPLACPPAEPLTIPMHTINENDPEWNFDPEESMDDLLSGLLMHQPPHHEI